MSALTQKLALAVLAGSVTLSLAACSTEEAESQTTILESASLTSPDGRIVFELHNETGAPRYEVRFDGETVIAPSRLGFRFAEAAPLEGGLDLVATEIQSVDTEWEQPWGERRLVRDHHNELVAHFRRADDPEHGYDLRIRAFDSGVGFRYEVVGDAPHAIVDEITRINVPQHSTAWWVPAGQWNRYEYLYQETPLGAVDRAHSPFTLRLPDDGPYVAIHEAALIDYSGFYLDQGRGGSLDIRLAPGPDGVAVHTGARFTTPWRTIQIADEAVGLINSDIILNLNEPNVLGNVDWVEPGKYVGIWWGMHINTNTWGSGPTHGATTENTRRFIDFAAENGFAGVLVEGWNLGWDGDWFNRQETFSFTEPYPDFDLEGLTAYARERGVRIIGHHETSGDLTNYENQMEDAFALYERVGVAQVKTGYVADAGDLVRYDEDGTPRYEWHYGQYAVNHHLRVVQTAAEHHISINAHEPVKDTGVRRTYPNWIAREGARGQEYNAWGQPPNPPEHTAMLAFTRMLSGPMDFTPGIFNLVPRDDVPARVQTTLARQLALYVVLYSPIQMAADLPEHYEARPDAFQFIRDVPTDWEESIALQGEPGDFIVFARQERGGPDWYLGAATDEAPRLVSVPLDFLAEGQRYEAQIYRDGDDANWEDNPYAIIIETRPVSAGDTLDLSLAPGGGAAVRFMALED